MARILVFLLLVLLIGFLARTAWSLLKPIENIPNQKFYPISTNVKDRVNILIAVISADGPTFLAVASVAAGHKTVYLPLDPSLYTNLARSKGFYRLSSAWKLGNLAGNEGINLLRDSVSRLIAAPLDGYLATTGEKSSLLGKLGRSPAEAKNKLSNSIFLAQQLLWFSPPPELKGSLTGRELLSLLLKVRTEELREVNLEGTLIETQDGGVGVKTVDAAAFDSRLGLLFQEDEVVRAHPRVSIVNSSGLPGIGAAISRYVRNMGGEVIILENGSSVKKSVVMDHSGSLLAKRLAPILRAPITSDQKASRADMEILIGEDAKDIF